ncbi:helix-turn-helix transcriptional regulator [Achromobacter dolens]|uniref:helix-turn-helix transcriptional regulator n=1 Tax=Achromobacter dolens TaxID=1287738 RepID=UPI0006C8BB9A|nr:AlpA family phage regulatory protein [Achromobacter dolens]
MNGIQPPDALIKIARLIEITQLCRSSIYERYDEGSPSFDSSFPARVYLSPRTVRWRLSEVLAWIETRPRNSTDALGGGLIGDQAHVEKPVMNMGQGHAQ